MSETIRIETRMRYLANGMAFAALCMAFSARFLIWYPPSQYKIWTIKDAIPALASCAQDCLLLAVAFSAHWILMKLMIRKGLWRFAHIIFAIIYLLVLLLFTANLISIYVNRSALDLSWLFYLNLRDADTTTSMISAVLTPLKMLLIAICALFIPIASILVTWKKKLSLALCLNLAIFGSIGSSIAAYANAGSGDPLRENYKKQLPLLGVIHQAIWPIQSRQYLDGKISEPAKIKADISDDEWQGGMGVDPSPCCIGKNIIQITIDSVPRRSINREFILANAKHYPNLARLYRQGLGFNSIYANRPVSEAALGIMAASVYASNDVMRGNLEIWADKQVPNLAQILVSNGYTAAHFMSGQITYGGADKLMQQWGYSEVEGSKTIACAPDDAKLIAIYSHNGDHCTAAAATRWIATNYKSNAKPFYLWIWFTNPHTPYYNRDDPYRKGPRSAIERHSQSIRDTDAAIGQVLTELDARGLTNKSIILLSADHGEAFGEHGLIFHATGIYEEQIGLPLIISAPGIPKNLTSSTLGSLIDFAPTIAGMVGIAEPADWQGTSLFSPTRPKRIYFNSTAGGKIAGYRQGTRKYMLSSDVDAPFYFDLAVDPKEQTLITISGPEAKIVSARIGAFIQQRNQKSWAIISQ
jgi:arylsulfatase A-like enzyme